MRENKEKIVTSGDEDVAAPPLVQVASVQVGKRKSKMISSFVDLDDLPSRRGPKKQKSSKTSLPKVPKFTPPIVNLDEPLVDLEPVQTVHPVQSDPPRQPKASRKPSSSEASDHPSNLVLDKSYAWRTFKGIVTDCEVNECYNMSMKEFERSGVHDLFKVGLSLVLVKRFFFFFFMNRMFNSFSSICRLCQSSVQQLAKPRSSLQRPRRLRTKPRS